MIAACPDRRQLAEYLAGKISPSLEGEIETHLRDCRACQSAAAAGEPASDSMLRAIRRSAVADSGHSPPELAAALQAVGLLASPETLPSSKDVAADTGRLIRDYELQKKLGEGGMGAVYLAMHTRLKKPVAIKLLKSDRTKDASAIARFAVEMEAVGKLEHPHIVRALDAGDENGTHFLVMEYLAGIDLARLVRGLGRMELPDACELIRQAALGLHHAHDNEVIHRDVKPSNLMLLPSGKVKVLDLGLARYRPALRESQSLTRDHQVLGTLLYVAPEQLSPGGTVDARSDVFSLGVTLSELLLGRVPLRRGLAMAISTEEMAARPEVPPDIWRLIERMTAIAPAERPASMLEVAEALRPWASGANLPALLMRFTGQSTFAAVPTPGTGQLTPGGQWLSQPSDRMSGWTPIDVIPPPVTTTVLHPSALVAPPPIVETAASGSRRSTTALWLASICLAATAAVLGTIAVLGLPSRGVNAPAVTPTAPPVAIEFRHGEPGFTGVFEGLLERGALVAIDQQSGKRYPLVSGANALPPGNYRLEGEIAECALKPVSFTVTLPLAPAVATSTKPSEKRKSIAAEPQLIVVSPGFKFPFPSWKYLQLPSAPGALAKYRGNVTLGAGGETKLSFSVTLSVLGDEKAGTERWLEIDVYNDTLSYRETAVLLVDVAQWEERQSLRFSRGWVTASSDALTTRLRTTYGDESPGVLVAPLERDRDRLEELANSLGCGLPVERASVQQAMVLLFGDQCSAVPDWVAGLRSVIPVPTRWDLGLETASSVPEPHVKVSSEVPGISFYLSRCTSIPFSFDRIAITSPHLNMEFKLDGHQDSRPDAPARLPDLAELARLNQIVGSLPPQRQPFDVASLPDEDGAGVTLAGALTIPGVPKIDYSADLRAVDRELVDEVPHRWIEIAVRSGEHEERALLLVNEPQYNDEGRLVIARGWFECQGHVFELESKVDLREIEESLYFLGSKGLPPLRLGVHDVATLVFGASLQSSFDPVRREFADHVTRHKLDLEPEHLPGYNLAKARISFDAIKYHLPAVAGDASGAGYTIIRSDDSPFDFLDVDLTTDKGFRLTALVEKVWPAKAAEADREAALMEQFLKTRNRLAEAKEKKPNFRLWTITDRAGNSYRKWAEYGGRVGQQFLLCDMFGSISKPPHLLAEVTEEDRAVIDAGRVWLDKNDKILLQGEMIGLKGATREPIDVEARVSVVMQNKGPDAGDMTIPLARFRPDFDQRLLIELQKLVPQVPSRPTVPPKGMGRRPAGRF
jgi:serine/threonine protein kinase